jgi:hypothetical protein
MINEEVERRSEDYVQYRSSIHSMRHWLRKGGMGEANPCRKQHISVAIPLSTGRLSKHHTSTARQDSGLVAQGRRLMLRVLQGAPQTRNGNEDFGSALLTCRSCIKLPRMPDASDALAFSTSETGDAQELEKRVSGGCWLAERVRVRALAAVEADRESRFPSEPLCCDRLDRVRSDAGLLETFTYVPNMVPCPLCLHPSHHVAFTTIAILQSASLQAYSQTPNRCLRTADCTRLLL